VDANQAWDSVKRITQQIINEALEAIASQIDFSQAPHKKAKPIVIFTALTSFIGPWGDYIFARVILLDNTDSYNVAVGLVWIIQRENITQYFTTFLAGSVLVALPITLLFTFMQRYYIEGVTGGSVKG
jgi:ABC-type maltose transport system permease subunit